ncbi:esterase/lipase family protein [Almyronema epifaneia]|uniref:Esterase/lipase family protein n=1 Tax=Almyronema epifaneia S1 TaxID=2991925 RepID=A0ABW6IK59_9CYAN
MKILLIHGLSRSPLSLLSLELKLKRSGYATEQFGYLAIAETFEGIVARLHRRLQQLSRQGSYSIVAHSLGGILTRAALGLGQVSWPEHVVMLGTPNQPPRLAAYAWHLPPFRWISGQCGFNLSRSAFFASLPGLSSPYTIVAGTSGPRGVWSPFGDELNDGIVAFSETRLTPTDAVVQVPVWHTFMMNDVRVQKTVLQSLRLASSV